jgi:hypothetical protein
MADDHYIRRPAGGGDFIGSIPVSSAPEPAQSEVDAGPATSVEKIRQISTTLASFEASGCPVADGLRACRVTIPPAESEGIPHRALIEAVSNSADVHLRFRREQVSFELDATANSPFQFTSGPIGDPAAVFSGEELNRAHRAWGGDIDAAQSLRGEWSGDLSVNLAGPLQQGNGVQAWRAVRKTAVITQELAAYPWWRTQELIHDGGRPVVITVVDESGVSAQTPAFAVLSLDQLAGTGPLPGGVDQRRAQVESSSAAQVPNGLPLPEELELDAGSAGADLLAAALRPRAEACAWAWLSNATRVSAGNVTLEYFGYRRRAFTLGPAGYTAVGGQRAFRMYKWATAEPSPDRVLAIRQVVSLYEQDDLPDRPGDIVRAAEPLYRALRAGEVAAVLESQRQARSIAVDAARESAEAAQSTAKSAAERTIASLAAVVGIAVANATAVLSAADSRAIAIGIAALFVFLAFWAVFIEGPDMEAPISSFTADLPLIGHLLPPADRDAILKMQALKNASEAVRRVRIAAPSVYAAGALITLGVAYYKFGLRL